MSHDPRVIWTELLATGPDLQRRFENHPLRLHFGTDSLSRPILLLRMDTKPESVRLGESVSVEVGERAAQKEWALILTLQEPTLTESFIDLCIDLAERSSSGRDEEESLQIFKRALEEFRDLLSGGRGAALSLEELRGLVAELWFAIRMVTPASSSKEALLSWSGPLGAPQDFRFPDGSLIEIKAIHSQARSVKISSPEQLDPVDESELSLVTIGVEECTPGTSASVSLPSLITEFREALAFDPLQIDELDRRLRALGVSRSYRSLETPFVVTGTRRYLVADTFPRIRRQAVVLGIERLKYEIELRAITEFEVDREIAFDRSER